ncbi:unnamed protein product [Cyclocybe aegerita]|uniref:Uncharacterized protein n=1 Tax=Cyclocybe aegerita TaxID=1973307 RepID=A0A8S0XMT2_CYCAE|nr:unnamed protein product [Cyclocybe aegerita]
MAEFLDGVWELVALGFMLDLDSQPASIRSNGIKKKEVRQNLVCHVRLAPAAHAGGLSFTETIRRVIRQQVTQFSTDYTWRNSTRVQRGHLRSFDINHANNHHHKLDTNYAQTIRSTVTYFPTISLPTPSSSTSGTSALNCLRKTPSLKLHGGKNLDFSIRSTNAPSAAQFRLPTNVFQQIVSKYDGVQVVAIPALAFAERFPHVLVKIMCNLRAEYLE